MIDSRDITKEFILERVKQEDIFRKYLQIDEVKFGKLYINPLREDDDTPSSNFDYDKRGMLKFSDWPMRGRPNWSIDCFNLVQILYNCSFKEALLKIYEHFNLIDDSVPTLEISKLIDTVKQKSQKKIIKVKIKKWNNVEINYWKQFYINEELLSLYNVYPIEKAWINDTLIYVNSIFDIGFVYFFGNDIIKLYFPLRDKTESRFIQNSGSILQGSQQLSASGDFCIITKSYKDVICLRMFGIEAVAPMSESVLISQRQHSILLSRFEKLYSLFDYDKSGIRIAVKHKIEYNIPILMFDKNQDKKDFSDNLKKYGIDHMNDYIEQVKEKYL